jgi:IS4 transposase
MCAVNTEKSLRKPLFLYIIKSITYDYSGNRCDLTLSVEQIIEYYGARWKIEAGFKEIKQEIGSAKSQTRNADAVLRSCNQINFTY